MFEEKESIKKKETHRTKRQTPNTDSIKAAYIYIICI